METWAILFLIDGFYDYIFSYFNTLSSGLVFIVLYIDFIQLEHLKKVVTVTENEPRLNLLYV